MALDAGAAPPAIAIAAFIRPAVPGRRVRPLGERPGAAGERGIT
jgi:hypothetical protein